SARRKTAEEVTYLSREHELIRSSTAHCITGFADHFLSECIVSAAGTFRTELDRRVAEEVAARRKAAEEEEAARRKPEDFVETSGNNEVRTVSGSVESVFLQNKLDERFPRMVEDELSRCQECVFNVCEALLIEWLVQAADLLNSEGGSAITTVTLDATERTCPPVIKAHDSDRSDSLGVLSGKSLKASPLQARETSTVESVQYGESVENTTGDSLLVSGNPTPVLHKEDAQIVVTVPISAAVVKADIIRKQLLSGDQVNIALGPAVTGEVWSCPTSGVKKGGGSNAAMTEAVTVYIVEQAGVAVEAIGDAGDLSYATVEATLWRGLIGATSAAVVSTDEVTEEWRAGLRALAERIASDYVYFASKQKLRKLDEYLWHAEAFLTPEEITARSIAAVTPRRFFNGLQRSDLRFLIHHYVELARKGTLNEDIYTEARLRENLFERQHDDVVSPLLSQQTSGTTTKKNNAGGRTILAVNRRRAGLTQLVLGHALENLLEETVAETSKWIASLVAN
ncbi:putative kinetoplast DNA-associated protein, partial [Trypanosoma cruzi]